MTTQERIVQKAAELVLKYGIKAVTMDDIASQIGTSKKTIYQYYPDKAALIKEVLTCDLQQFKDRCCVDEACPNAVVEAISALEFMDLQMQEMNPLVLHELQKLYPDLYNIFLDFKENHLSQTIRKNIERGISEGLYRSDINIDILVRYRVESSLMVFNTDMYPAKLFNLVEVSHQLFEHFIRGLLTSKGHTIIEKYKAKLILNNEKK
jgi:TetR/AcrR family transcriptional regulator, cholesterol catabolism regulator